MLQTLSIKQFVIIDELEIHFSDGLTVLSGETGSGKSIIIDAIGQLIECVHHQIMFDMVKRKRLLKAYLI